MINKHPDFEKQSQKLHKILTELFELNPEIDTAVWLSGFITTYICSFHKSGASYEDLCGSLEEVKKQFVHLWEKDEIH